VVTSAGDALGDLVERERVGRAVAPGDADGFAAACADLLEDASGERARIAELAPSLRWSEVTRPLIRWCERATALPPRRSHRRVLRRAIRGQYLRALPETARTKGVGPAVRQIGRRLGRALGSRRSGR
jgi:hypothetical protein